MANPLTHPQLNRRGRPSQQSAEPRPSSVPLALAGVAVGAVTALALSREEVALLLSLRGHDSLMPAEWWRYHAICLLLLLASSFAASAVAVSPLHFLRRAALRRVLVGVALLAALVLAPLPAWSFASRRVPTGWAFSLPSAYSWAPLAAAVVTCITYTLGLAVFQRRAASPATP